MRWSRGAWRLVEAVQRGNGAGCRCFSALSLSRLVVLPLPYAVCRRSLTPPQGPFSQIRSRSAASSSHTFHQFSRNLSSSLSSSSQSTSHLSSPPKRRRRTAAVVPPAEQPNLVDEKKDASGYEEEVEVDEKTGFIVVDLKDDGTAQTEEEAEGVWAPIREKLEKEGAIVTEEGEEIISMEELERRLAAEGYNADEDVMNAEEEDDGEEVEEDIELDQEKYAEEEEAEEKEDEAVPPIPYASSSSSSRPRSSRSSNTLWIQERKDGTVHVVPWPYSDSSPLPSLSQSYDLNIPPPSPSSIVGQSIGGEKMSVRDVTILREKDLSEHFSKGGGKGGQKVNKTSNCVHLHHIPTGTIVKCHATRSLAENRKIARKIMKERLEELLMGPASSNQLRKKKIQKNKAKSRRRSASKYGEMREEEQKEEEGEAQEMKSVEGKEISAAVSQSAKANSSAAVTSFTSLLPSAASAAAAKMPRRTRKLSQSAAGEST